MKNWMIFLLIFNSIGNVLYSQEISEENRLQYLKILYNIDKASLSPKNYLYKIEPFDINNYFAHSLSETQINQCLESINNSKELKIIDFFDDLNLNFTAQLPDFLNHQFSDELLISILENELFFNSQKLVLANISNDNSGYAKINLKIQLENSQIDSTRIKGKVVFALNFLKKYDSIKLTKNDIGKLFELNNQIGKIINIIDNKIVLSGDFENIKHINLIKKDSVSKPYSYFELLELQEANPDMIDLSDGAFSQFKIGIYKTEYDIFQKNLSISFDDYEKIMTLDLLKGLKDEERYTILKDLAPFENDFILFIPVYEQKIVEVEY